MQYRLLFIIVMLVFCFRYGQAQEAKPKAASTVGAVFNFRFDRAVLDSGYMHNAASLKELNRILSDTSTISTIDSIRITATSSIDGNIDRNRVGYSYNSDYRKTDCYKIKYTNSRYGFINTDRNTYRKNKERVTPPPPLLAGI